MAQLVNELSDFSEPKIWTTELLDINALFSDIITILQKSHMAGSNIKVHQNLDPSLPSFNMDKNRLKQVFINLIKNATEALTLGGNIYISTRFASDSFVNETSQDKDVDSGYVEIMLRDDGPGIPDTLKSRLFEPFITSKGAGHAGLGLSIVYNTVKELKGTIICESDTKKGATFKILLPVQQNKAS